MSAISGTKEWAEHSINCCIGCEHGCLYCYAREVALHYGTIKSPAEWATPRIRDNAVDKKYGKFKGTVMFPTTHDITPGNLNACLTVLDKLLTSGNRILIVSKAHTASLRAIVAKFPLFTGQILFRLTIGSLSESIREFWEPNAPTNAERIEALMHVHRAGFETSVSCEPLLQAEAIVELVDRIRPFVTHSIWIGKANQLQQRCAWRLPSDHPAIIQVLAGQTDEMVHCVYKSLKDDPLLRWKESYKKVLGLKLATRPGQDV